MTSTGTFQGLNADRNSSKVLKPPGGGSSDIFGSSGQTSPRRIKNHNQSQLSSGFFGDSTNTGNTSPDSPRGNKPGNDSYKRLFGPPEPINPNTKNHMRSNISLSSSDYQDNLFTIKKMNGINGVLPSNGNSIINGNAFTNDNTDGNPVTGAGYIENGNNGGSQNGSSASSINGDNRSTTDSSPASVTSKPVRGRVPPGGFSSGLW
ncbi:hypothetical protein HCN44_002844 [Aphidius gifuensis]|uniref:Microtubule-associated protein Jupiter n=1 Tax=Aphidius gifuensis TaxID=684658 RepID=A0A834XTE9_APHGI|nr:microtubule-associated protein Jupiter isoform X5 [Aphidius gifuensis]KAF7991282.1 hypothetical protein HCN44_002844 [Aphidius gifuensis]